MTKVARPGSLLALDPVDLSAPKFPASDWVKARKR